MTTTSKKRAPKATDISKSAAFATVFPDVHPGIEPFGSRIIVQVRKPLQKVGSLWLTSDTQEAEKYNMQIARVVAVGPVAFKHRRTLEAWPEGACVEIGDVVRVPKFGGDRWEIADGSDSKVWFALIEDTDLIGRHVGDPTTGMATL